MTIQSHWLRSPVSLARSAVLLATIACLSDAHAQAKSAKPEPSDALIGEWWTEGNEGRVRFTRDRDGTFRGTTTCCIPEQVTATRLAKDTNNPNPKLRDRSTVGMVIIWKLTYEENGEYTGGYVYNPRDGKTYRMQVTVVDKETVKIRGYVGIPLLGQSQLWKRARTSTKP